MSIKEIDKRISFLRKAKIEEKRVELKNLFSILHSTISFANSPTKGNNKKFSKYLDKVFDDKEPENKESLKPEDVMNLFSRGNVKK